MISLRPETPLDYEAIDELLILAFAFDAHSKLNESKIVRELRNRGKCTLSFVACLEDGEVVGQILFSPVMIHDGTQQDITGWVALGPMSVNPRLQRMGIGRKLMDIGLLKIREMGTEGCVVLGEPGFYHHFGFRSYEDLILPGALAPYFLAQPFTGSVPSGNVSYDESFNSI
jgi:putative acetyltransferase